MQLPAVPVLLAVTGMMAVEWRAVCACRDGNVYTVKGGELTGTVIELESMPSCLVRLEKAILVGCMSNQVCTTPAAEAVWSPCVSMRLHARRRWSRRDPRHVSRT